MSLSETCLRRSRYKDTAKTCEVRVGCRSKSFSLFQEVKNFYEEQRLLEQQQREEEAEAEVVISKISDQSEFRIKFTSGSSHILYMEFYLFPPGEKRPKTKKAKLDFPVYQTSSETCFQGYEQTSSIEEIEEQMDTWLKERQDTKRKVNANKARLQGPGFPGIQVLFA